MAELPPAAEGFLETELGTVKYIVNQGDHVYLDAGDAYSGTGHLLVNRVPYKVSLHLHLVDGVWKLKNYHDLYMSRRDSVGRDATDAAYQKTLAALTEAWTAFIAGSPQLLATGEIYAVSREIERAEEEIAKLEVQLGEQHAIRDRAVRRLRELGYHGPNKQDWSARF